MRYFVKYDGDGNPVQAAKSETAEYGRFTEVKESTYRDAKAAIESRAPDTRTRGDIAADLRDGKITEREALLELLEL